MQDRQAAQQAQAQVRRTRGRRRGGPKRAPITKLQMVSIAVMVFLGLAVVGSTFLPYIVSGGGGATP